LALVEEAAVGLLPTLSSFGAMKLPALAKQRSEGLAWCLKDVQLRPKMENDEAANSLPALTEKVPIDRPQPVIARHFTI
jgi:hypothetical protein